MTDELAATPAAPTARLPSKERRAQIYRVAAETFYEHGYAATSVDQIAENVGILKGSLYYYMKTKEDLLFHIIQQAHEDLTAQFEHAQSEGGDVVQQLTRTIKTHVEYICNNPISTGVFLNDFRFLSEERRAIIVRYRDAYDSRLRSLLEDGQSQGVFSAEMNVKLVTFGLLGMVNWVHQWHHAKGGLSPDEIAAGFVNAILWGIMAGDRQLPDN